MMYDNDENSEFNDHPSKKYGFTMDSDDLVGQSKSESFALGFELGQLCQVFGFKENFRGPARADNKDRLKKIADICNKDIDFRWINDDWIYFTVTPKD